MDLLEVSRMLKTHSNPKAIFVSSSPCNFFLNASQGHTRSEKQRPETTLLLQVALPVTMDTRPGTRAGPWGTGGVQPAGTAEAFPALPRRQRDSPEPSRPPPCGHQRRLCLLRAQPRPAPRNPAEGPGRTAELTAGPPEADDEAWRRGPPASRCSEAVWAEGLRGPRA